MNEPREPIGRERAHEELERLRHLAYLLDDAFRIPLIGRRFGFDALIGLIPVVGDLTGFVMSAYLVWRARRLGVPASLQRKMIANSVFDLFIGSVPVIGDLIDFFIKPNRRSIRILERYLLNRETSPDEPLRSPAHA